MDAGPMEQALRPFLEMVDEKHCELCGRRMATEEDTKKHEAEPVCNGLHWCMSLCWSKVYSGASCIEVDWRAVLKDCLEKVFPEALREDLHPPLNREQVGLGLTLAQEMTEELEKILKDIQAKRPIERRAMRISALVMRSKPLAGMLMDSTLPGLRCGRCDWTAKFTNNMLEAHGWLYLLGVVGASHECPKAESGKLLPKREAQGPLRVGSGDLPAAAAQERWVHEFDLQPAKEGNQMSDGMWDDTPDSAFEGRWRDEIVVAADAIDSRQMAAILSAIKAEPQVAGVWHVLQTATAQDAYMAGIMSAPDLILGAIEARSELWECETSTEVPRWQVRLIRRAEH